MNRRSATAARTCANKRADVLYTLDVEQRTGGRDGSELGVRAGDTNANRTIDTVFRAH